MILEPPKFAGVLGAALEKLDQVEPDQLPILWSVAGIDMDLGQAMGGLAGQLLGAAGIKMVTLGAAAVRLPDGFWGTEPAGALAQFAANVAWGDPAVTGFFWHPLPLGMAGWFVLDANGVTGVDLAGVTYTGTIGENSTATVTWSDPGQPATGGLHDGLWLLALGTGAYGLDPYRGKCEDEAHQALLEHSMPALPEAPGPVDLVDLVAVIDATRRPAPASATAPEEAPTE